MALPLELHNLLLLLAQAVLYFSVMALLFLARAKIGIGVFVCALGVMHFLETYLASVFYIQLPFGIISPGSTVLFSGKLLMILLLYIKEDAATVRGPIYGLLIGNFLIVALVMVLRNHEVVLIAGRQPDIAFVDEMGWLMVWGTMLLFVDAIGIILLYEKLGTWFRDRLFVRVFLSSAAMLTFDQAGFFLALHFVSGAPWIVLFGGWAAKMVAALVFSLMVVAYLRYVERPGTSAPAVPISDIFDMLTYRERYQELLERSGRDGLTGALDRGQFEILGRQAVEERKRDGVSLSLLAVDVDHFKSINDRFGHAAGDEALRRIADLLSGSLRQDDKFFRYGGEEFVVLCQGLDHPSALGLAERLRRAIEGADLSAPGETVTISVGVATTPDDGSDLDSLFATADARLYAAKDAGRNRVVGDRPAGLDGTEVPQPA